MERGIRWRSFETSDRFAQLLKSMSRQLIDGEGQLHDWGDLSSLLKPLDRVEIPRAHQLIEQQLIWAKVVLLSVDVRGIKCTAGKALKNIRGSHPFTQTSYEERIGDAS